MFIELILKTKRTLLCDSIRNKKNYSLLLLGVKFHEKIETYVSSFFSLVIYFSWLPLNVETPGHKPWFHCKLSTCFCIDELFRNFLHWSPVNFAWVLSNSFSFPLADQKFRTNHFQVRAKIRFAMKIIDG